MIMEMLQSSFWDTSLCGLCTIKTVSKNGNVYFHAKTVSKHLKVLSVVKEMNVPFGSERCGNDTILLLNLTGMEDRLPNFCQMVKEHQEKDEVDIPISSPTKKKTYYKSLKTETNGQDRSK